VVGMSPTKLMNHLRRATSCLRRFDRRLNVCPTCRCDFVVPVSWEERGDTHWWIRLRCGQCGFVREVDVDNEAAERLETALAVGEAQIAAVLDRLDRERMVADSVTLAAALERDLIGPADFSPREPRSDGWVRR
jgi:hypothetical protein